MVAGALREMIEALEQDHSLDGPDRLRLRIESLDRLDAWLVDERLHPSEARPFDDDIDRRARTLYSRMEKANTNLYSAIRRGTQRSAGPGALLELVHGQSSADASIEGTPRGEGYDYLDELIGGIFQFEGPDQTGFQLTAEMVPYQPTPARHIFDMIERVGFTERDVLIDLGSGLGHVPLLTSICTGARSIGIELDASYVECARRSATTLNLNSVTFIQQDARDADLSSGTVFYLYTPFIGAILRAVLDSLKRQASHRRIRICAYGSVTFTIAEEKWLEFSGALESDRIVIFSSRS
jgi:hypothetical protein